MIEDKDDDHTPEDCGASDLHCSGVGDRLFQIYEDDLAQLERSLPVIAEAVEHLNDRRVKVHLRRLKQIISNVRWDYGPHDEVERIEA